MIFNIILIFLFVWMNLYSLANLTKLEKRFYEFDIESISFKQYLYYISKLIYWIWILFGLFTAPTVYFLILLSLPILKFLMFYLNKKLFKIFNVLIPFISIITLVVYFISYIKLFQILFCNNYKFISFFITPVYHSLPLIFILISHF